MWCLLTTVRSRVQWYDYDRNIQGPWGDTWYTVWCIACTHDCTAVQWIVSNLYNPDTDPRQILLYYLSKKARHWNFKHVSFLHILQIMIYRNCCRWFFKKSEFQINAVLE